MTARILKAHQTETEAVLVVHLDDRRMTDDGEPDPAYVRRWTWPLIVGGVVQTDYLDRLQREARALVKAELAAMESARGVDSLVGQLL